MTFRFLSTIQCVLCGVSLVQYDHQLKGQCYKFLELQSSYLQWKQRYYRLFCRNFGSKRNTNLNLNWIHFSSLHGFSDRYEKSFGGIEDRYIESPKNPFLILRSVRIHCYMCFKIKKQGANVTFESKSFNQCQLE